MKITADMIYAVAPGAKREIVDGIVAGTADFLKFGIVAKRDIAFFLGRAAVETAGFTRLEENLYYTSTKRLRQVWPGRFKSDAAAAPYVRNPQALANLTYGGRLGNVLPNDGWLYRGSGDFQTTGGYNFRKVQIGGGIPCINKPELLREHPGALTAALVYWKDNNLGRFVAANDVAGLCKAVQGGLAGLADQRLFTDRALRAVDGVAPPRVDTSGWLRKGDKGSVVREAQGHLQRHGFYVGGKLDADFGDGMADAVEHFQRARGLVADGVIGTATWEALRAVASPTAPDPHAGPADVPTVPVEAPGIWQLLVTLLTAIFGALRRKP